MWSVISNEIRIFFEIGHVETRKIKDFIKFLLAVSMEEIMQLEQVHAKLDQEVSKLEEIRGYLSYENVLKLNKLKKQKLLIKDQISNLKGF